jgi:parallel beta-helix repeat protein
MTKFKKFLPLLIIGVILVGLSLSSFSMKNLTERKINNTDLTPSAALTSHSPISINYNAGLGSFCTVGDGSFANPYIIENYIIDATSDHGIDIWKTDAYLTIRNCVIKNGGQYFHGIKLMECDHVNISGNKISNFGIGIYLDYSRNNFISGNTANNNHVYGIKMYDSSYNNKIWNNIFDNNYNARTDNLVNQWDNGTHGNYWGDYYIRYPVAINDGTIWNTPYQIEGSGAYTDRYPLVLPSPTSPTLQNFNSNPDPDGIVALDWDDVSGATSYKVYRNTSTIASTTGLTPIANLSGSLYTDTNLTNGIYYYAVVALNGSGYSAISNCVSVQVLILFFRPVSPSLEFRHSSDYVRDVWLDWDKIIGATSYKVYRDTSPIVSTTDLTPIVTVDSVGYQDTLPMSYGKYYYVITAINGSGVSAISNCVSVEYKKNYFTPLNIIYAVCSIVGVGGIIAVFMKKKKRKQQIEKERLQKENLERLEKERLEKERLEKERIAKQKKDQFEQFQKEQKSKQQELENDITVIEELMQKNEFENAIIKLGIMKTTADNYELANLTSQITRKLDTCKINQRILSQYNDLSASYNQGQLLKVHNEISELKTQIQNDSSTASMLMGSILDKINKLQQKINHDLQEHRKSIESELNKMSNLLKEGNFDQSIVIIKEQQMKAKEFGFNALVKTLEERRNQLEKYIALFNIFKNTKKMVITDVCDMMEIERKELVKMVIEKSEILKGFKIEGEYLMLGESADLSQYMSDLNNQFSDWKAKENSKDGKIEDFNMDNFDN